MCFECRVLGALLVESGEDASCPTAEDKSTKRGLDLLEGMVHRFDFCPTVLEIEDKELRDYSAEEYLSETLQRLGETFGVELVPITVDSDGSCLPHAISRCLIGKEILYDALRSALEKELVENKSFYQSVFEHGMDQDTFDTYWSTVCEEAQPTHSAQTDRWLGPEHILGFANLLKRPILVLDKPDEMEKGDYRSGMYLPLRHSREDCQDEQGNMSCPLVIGWAGEEKNHFISLVVPTRNALLATEDDFLADRVAQACPELWETVELMMQARENASEDSQVVNIEIPLDKKPGDMCMLRDPATGEEFVCKIPSDKHPGESFEFRVPGELSKSFTKLKRAVVHFFALNPPILRQKSCVTMHKLVSNLVDAILMGDSAKIAKFSQFPLDNKTIQASVVMSHGALSVMHTIGFEEYTEEESGRLLMRFKEDLFQPQTTDVLVVARDILGLLRVNSNFALGGGQIPFGEQQLAFGPSPAFLPSWEEAAQYSRLIGSDVWLFGQGNHLRLKQIDSLRDTIQQLKSDFEYVSQGTDFACFPWDDLIQYNAKLNQVKCPRCGRCQAELGTCDDCGNELDVQHTGQRRMSQFVKEMFSQRRLRFCSSHNCLFRDDQPCSGQV